MKIDDGTGLGYQAKVDNKNRLSAFSVTEPEDKYVNREGLSWSIKQSTTAVGGGDYVFYLKNTGESTLAITDFRVLCGAATTLSINAVSGTPTYTAGVSLTPVNRNLGSSKSPDAIIYEDTNTTGLTSLGELFFIRCNTANLQEDLKSSSNIIIPQGQAVAVSTSAATSVTMLVSLSSLDS